MDRPWTSTQAGSNTVHINEKFRTRTMSYHLINLRHPAYCFEVIPKPDTSTVIWKAVSSLIPTSNELT